MCEAFARCYEILNNSEFKGRNVSWREFKEWYIMNSPLGREADEFVYHEEVDGFTFTSKVKNFFYDNKFKPFSAMESDVKKMFKQIKEEEFVIISTASTSIPTTLNHEIAHASFELIPEYNQESLRNLELINPKTKQKINKSLERTYIPAHWPDETQAFLATDYDYLMEDGVKRRHVWQTARKQKVLFKKFCDRYIYG